MELTELKIFKAVAEQGGILRAASTLNRVQSNVTTRVKQLEARLGTRLFSREGRRLVLTAEGKVLLGYAERLLQLSSEAQAAVKGRAPHGALKLGALESTAATRLPPVLARFHKAHPAVRLELLHARGDVGLHAIERARRAQDAALLGDRLEDPQLGQFHIL